MEAAYLRQKGFDMKMQPLKYTVAHSTKYLCNSTTVSSELQKMLFSCSQLY